MATLRGVSDTPAHTVDMKVARYREMTSLARVVWERSYDPKLDRWLKRVCVPTLILWVSRTRSFPYSRCGAGRIGSGLEQKSRPSTVSAIASFSSHPGPSSVLRRF
jgi:hypothetical protein